MKLQLTTLFLTLPLMMALEVPVSLGADTLGKNRSPQYRLDSSGVVQVAVNRGDEKVRRVALIIGNSSYPESPLKNPVNDAASMASTLKKLGFEVIVLTDANLQQMDEAVSLFREKLQQGSVGAFYYAGHGIQAEGENYLIPINAKLEVEQDLRYQALPIGRVLGIMESVKNTTNIVILDACRNNPLQRRWRSFQRGLAPINTATGVYIAYATAPGKTADDGVGRNGTFTAALLKNIVKPHEGIDQLFNRIREEVNQETNGRQVPWTTSSLIGNFSFNAPKRSIAAPLVPFTPKSLVEQETDLPDSIEIPCPGSVCEASPGRN